ncbi:hypothetical protein AAB158_22850 [Peribacillus frigoritolerans]
MKYAYFTKAREILSTTEYWDPNVIYPDCIKEARKVINYKIWFKAGEAEPLSPSFHRIVKMLQIYLPIHESFEYKNNVAVATWGKNNHLPIRDYFSLVQKNFIRFIRRRKF